eukprot:gi/632975744/ref/XP_007904398.1/ PREDICTED: peripheral-type benzodiazepine receptor-associated protein 1-like [Callorhinchus milii]
MREVAERRHQLEVEHEDAVTILKDKQEEVQRLQQAQFEAQKEHEGVVVLLENTLDSMQAKVLDLEEKCRSQSEQFCLLSRELERFRRQSGNIDVLTNSLVTSEPSVPVFSQTHHSETPVPMCSQTRQLEPAVPVFSQPIHSATPVQLGDQTHHLAPSVPICSQTIPSEPSVPVCSQTHYSEPSVPVCSQTHYSEPSVPVCSQTIPSETPVPLGDQTHQLKPSVPVGDETHQSETSDPVCTQTIHPETSIPLSSQTIHSEMSDLAGDQIHHSETSIPVLTQTHQLETSIPVCGQSQTCLLNGVDSPKDKEVVPQTFCLPKIPEEPTEEAADSELPTEAVSKSEPSEELPTDTGSVFSKGAPSTQSSNKGTSKTESLHSSPKSCPTPEVDTASEVEELDIDNLSSIPDADNRTTAKLQVFIARYSYNPFDGPNENPEAELPLTAGDYIYVYGDMDEDGFYEGELVDGRRGLVPSNFIERVSDENMLVLHPPEVSEPSQSSFQESSFHSGSERSLSLHRVSNAERQEEPALETNKDKPESLVSNGFDPDLEEVGEDVVPYPRKLNLIKQLAKSIVLSWEPPIVPAGWGTALSYNIHVDKELRLNIKFGSQTKAVIERLELNARAYRICIQIVTDKGSSDQLRSTMLVGKDVCVAPMQLKVQNITASSADISWLPSNSNYSHALFLNEAEYEVVKPGNYVYALINLRPNMKYKVKVEARPQQTPWQLPLDRRQLKSIYTQFSTLIAGPPDAPLDVQVEAGPDPGVLLISWLPVTIDAAGTSNGVRVMGYAVYTAGYKITEVASPTAGTVLLSPTQPQLQLLQTSATLTVRTLSTHGESVDSSPGIVPASLLAAESPTVPMYSTPRVWPHAQIATPSDQELPDPVLPDQAQAPCSASNVPSSESRIHHFALLPQTPVEGTPSADVCQEPVQRDGTESEEKLQSSVQERGEEEPPTPQDNEGLESPVASIEDFLLDSEENEDSVCSTTTEPSDENEVSDNVIEQEPEVSVAVPETVSSVNTFQHQSEGPVADDSQCSVKVESSQEFPTDSESKQEDLSAPKDEQLTEELQLGTGESGQVNKTDSFENEDYQLETGQGSDLSDIMEEDEEELGSDTQANEDTQQGDFLTSSSSLKPALHPQAQNSEPYETDSDEEFLEKILDIPLQKQCSKKLFSIPEVAEEEEEESRDDKSGASDSAGLAPTGSLEPMAHISSCLQCSEPQQQEKPLTRVDIADTGSALGPPVVRPQDLGAGKASHSNGDRDRAEKASSVSEPIPRAAWEESQVLPDAVHDNKQQDLAEKMAHVPNATSNANTNAGSNERNEKAHKSAKPGAPVRPTVHHRYPRSRRREARTRASNVQELTPAALESSEKRLFKQQPTHTMERSEPTMRLHALPDTAIRHRDQHAMDLALHGNPLLSLTERNLEIDVEYGTEEEEELPAHSSQVVDIWCDALHAEREGSDASSQGECTHSANHTREFQRQSSVEDEVFERNSVNVNRSQHHRRKEAVGALRSLAHHAERERLSAHTNRLREEQESLALQARIYELGRARAMWHPKDATCIWDLQMMSDPQSPLQDSPAESDVNTKDSSSPLQEPGSLNGSSRNGATGVWAGGKLSETENPSQGLAIRVFVALFDYDPVTMSPNQDTVEELAFTEGQILKVLGDKDADGFYHGEASGRAGLVPCNMVSEIQVDDEGIMEQLLQRGYLAPSTSMHRLGSRTLSPPPRRTVPPPKPRRSKKGLSHSTLTISLALALQSAAWEDVKYRERRSLGSGAQPGPPRRMMAMFDYNPRESSPNVDIEAELTFSAGDIITVYGDMDEDGFYNGNLNGQHGLVPSNFLEVHPENEPKTSPTLHPVANRERPRIWADAQLAGLSEHAVSTSAYSPDPALSPDSQRHGSVDSGVDGDQHDWADDGERHNGNKKKRGFFSKGKKLFKRLGSSKREQPPLGVRGQYNTK